MDSGVKIVIVAAVADNGVIGRGSEIPWRLKNDLAHFKNLTRLLGTVIVGRKTHEGIIKRLGRPLPDRRTIVVTRQAGYQAPGCEVASSLEEALECVKDAEAVAVIGGAELYREALPKASEIFLTRVHGSPEGDVFFPPLNSAEWQCRDAYRIQETPDEDNDFAATVEYYERCSFVNLDNVRFADQRVIMERIAKDGACPFCPENRKSGEVLEPLWRGKHWVIVPNRWPYENTILHLMAISERHISSPHELVPAEWMEFREAVEWVIAAHGLRGGAIGMRFGDTRMTGATVQHFHVHFIAADPDPKPGSERVRFPMGPIPPVKR